MQVMKLKKCIKKLKWFLYSNKILNNLSDMVLFSDSDGVILWANKKAHENLKIISNTTINEIIKGGMRTIRESIKNEKNILVTAIIHGIECQVELSASKTNKNYCICLNDRTLYIKDSQHKKALNNFNDEKNFMISKIDKELLSPLDSITGFSQGMLDGIAGELTEKQIKYLKIINSNAAELREFTEKFTDFSECESSLYEHVINKFDVILKIKNILKDYKAQFKLKNIAFDFYYDAISNRNINFDEKAFEKIITNIIEISLSATEHGTIAIHLAEPNEENSIAFGLNENQKYLQIMIKDSGAGFSEEEMKYICNPYAQIEKGRKPLLRSLRMGIVSILVKRNNGFININSEVMHGSLYNIIIPTQKGEDE